MLRETLQIFVTRKNVKKKNWDYRVQVIRLTIILMMTILILCQVIVICRIEHCFPTHSLLDHLYDLHHQPQSCLTCSKSVSKNVLAHAIVSWREKSLFEELLTSLDRLTTVCPSFCSCSARVLSWFISYFKCSIARVIYLKFNCLFWRVSLLLQELLYSLSGWFITIIICYRW